MEKSEVGESAGVSIIGDQREVCHRKSSREQKLSEKGAAYLLQGSEQARARFANSLKQKQIRLMQIVEGKVQPVDIVKFRADYTSILQIYEEFLNHHEICQELLQDAEKDDDFINCFSECNGSFLKFKAKAEQWLCSQEQLLASSIKPIDSVSQVGSQNLSKTSHASSDSRISYLKAMVCQRKAELVARSRALEEKRRLKKERRALEEAEHELKDKEEEFEIKTELEVAEAKYQAMEEYQRSDRDVEQKSVNLVDNDPAINIPEVPQVDFASVPQHLESELNPNAPVWSSNACTDSALNKQELDVHPVTTNPSVSVLPEIISNSQKVPTNDAYTSMLTVAREMKKPTPEIHKFSGNAMEFNPFMRQFNARVCANTESYDERLNYLLQFTTGEAHKIALGYSHLNADLGFKAAIEEFKDRYGDPDVVAQAYVKKALEWPTLKADDPKSLDEFAIFMRECQFAVQNVEAARVLEYSENLKLLMRKLPFHLHDKWRTVVYDTKSKGFVVRFGQFVEFIRREAKKANDPTFGRGIVTKRDGFSKFHGKENTKVLRPVDKRLSCATNFSKSTEIGNLQNDNNTNKELVSNVSESTQTYQQTNRNFSKGLAFINPCLYCKSTSHALDKCSSIKEKALKDRYAFLKTKGLCFGCLRSGHQKESCRIKQTCGSCDKLHPSILHMEPKSDNTVTMTSVSDMGARERQTLPIVPVRVKHKNSDKFVETYAFLDSGSTATFCTEQLMHTLNIEGHKAKVNLHTMVQDKMETCFIVRGLEICSISGENVVELPAVLTQPKLPVSSTDIIYPHDLQRWPYLKKVPLHRINSGIDLLIGVNVPKALQPWDVIPSQNNGPFAVKTAFGWLVNGPVDVGEMKDDSGACMFASVNRIKVTLSPTLDEQLREHFSTDFSERAVDDIQEPSREERQFLDIVEKSVKHVDGHYVINLPFRDSQVKMPNNKKQAEHRMWLLGKRFEKDEKLYHDYKDFMTKIIEKGYAKAVSSECLEQDDGRVWFLPHHGVYHPQKKKLRVVFDCAASYKGTSLNHNLLQGPYLTNTLIGTLIRFRQERIALMGDIESMFYQVHVPQEHSSFLRFLWWQDGDIDKPIRQFQMVVHLFGANSSPSVCNFALRKAALDVKGQIDDEVVNTVLKNFYVDDCLKSVDTVKKAVSLVKDLKYVLNCGGFNITKWVSNSREVMHSLPVFEWATEIRNLDLEQESLPIERALGVYWNAEKDMFEFRLNLKDKPPSRRGILSLTSSIYDPLGFVAPVILQAKCLLQELCRLRLDWDEKIPEHLEEIWIKWLLEVPALKEFKVMRCLKPPGFGILGHVEFHHFSDASQIGYGVVSYLRLMDLNGMIHVTLLSGKARVAPLKQVTIPRLELTAATVAVRVDNMLRRELDLAITTSYFWTDSMSVLRYIHNDTSRFHTFVANRLTVIHEGSDVSQWRYVPSKMNPGDLASRGCCVTKFLNSKEWNDGPSFLMKCEREWPTQPTLSPEILTDDPEVKKCSALVHVCVTGQDRNLQTLNPVLQLVNHYSCWNSLKRAVALLVRVRDALIFKVRQKKFQSDSSVKKCGLKCGLCLEMLSVNEIASAERIIIRNCQSQAFSSDIAMLKDGKPVKNTSNIKKLDPCLDDGLLRVGGRIARACMPEDTKHPVILPKDCRVSRLIIKYIHSSVGHLGRNSVLSCLREKYWVINAPSVVRKVLADCVVCSKLKAKPGSQKMADLPEDRLIPDEPPFTRVGMDYFGPIEVKQKRSRVKRYGVLFTCLNTRAIHLEVADSLDTSSCINAIRRFLARRGQCVKIISDNGTNLVGACRELKSAIKQWNANQIHDSLLQHDVEWQFNPPSASHFGGIWERMIRSVRQVLSGVLREQVLSDESLRTVMCEVESILNNRPITKVPNGRGDLEALTPNHLLLLKRKPSLPPGYFDKTDSYCSRRWRQVQYLADLFWKRWVREYLPLLQVRQKWFLSRRNFAVGDIVLVVDERIPRGSWPLGRVVETIPDRLGYVRRVRVKTQTNTLERPIHKLCLLLESDTSNFHKE